MNFSITVIGLWGRGLNSRSELAALLADPAARPDAAYEKPKPAAIPARERRRSGELINLAVEAAHQACADAAIDASQIASVFSSALSDTAVTDYMGRKLAATDKLLSPTKFHNSVHNAASGYWSISAANRAPSTFVSGFRESFGAGLLEAASLCEARAEPVLYVAYDMANSLPFRDFAPIEESLATAFVLTPAPAATGARYRLALATDAAATTPSPSTPRHSYLAELARHNFGGAGLTLAEACLLPRTSLSFPFTPTRSLELHRCES